MKLSELMRLGSMLRPQGFGKLMTSDGRSCAFGAAMEVLGKDTNPGHLEELWEIFDWTDEGASRDCPAACGRKGIPGGLILHLNDDHRWTREKIADWVESIEPSESPSPEVKEPAMEVEVKI
jgi:hypothetical protein